MLPQGEGLPVNKAKKGRQREREREREKTVMISFEHLDPDLSDPRNTRHA